MIAPAPDRVPAGAGLAPAFAAARARLGLIALLFALVMFNDIKGIEAPSLDASSCEAA